MKCFFIVVVLLCFNWSSANDDDDQMTQLQYAEAAQHHAIRSIVNRFITLLDKSYVCSEKCFVPFLFNSSKSPRMSMFGSYLPNFPSYLNQICAQYPIFKQCLSSCPEGAAKNLLTMADNLSSIVCSARFEAVSVNWQCIYYVVVKTPVGDGQLCPGSKLVNMAFDSFYGQSDFVSFTTFTEELCGFVGCSELYVFNRLSKDKCDKEAVDLFREILVTAKQTIMKYLLQIGVQEDSISDTCKDWYRNTASLV